MYRERTGKGCIVQYEDTPATAMVSGRMSFSGFNPQVEAANIELRDLQRKIKLEESECDTTVSDSAMTTALSRRQPGKTPNDAVTDGKASKRKAVQNTEEVALNSSFGGALLKRVKAESVDDADAADRGPSSYERVENETGPNVPPKKGKKKDKMGAGAGVLAKGTDTPRDRVIAKLKQLKGAS